MKAKPTYNFIYDIKESNIFLDCDSTFPVEKYEGEAKIIDSGISRKIALLIVEKFDLRVGSYGTTYIQWYYSDKKYDYNEIMFLYTVFKAAYGK